MLLVNKIIGMTMRFDLSDPSWKYNLTSKYNLDRCCANLPTFKDTPKNFKNIKKYNIQSQ